MKIKSVFLFDIMRRIISDNAQSWATPIRFLKTSFLFPIRTEAFHWKEAQSGAAARHPRCLCANIVFFRFYYSRIDAFSPIAIPSRLQTGQFNKPSANDLGLAHRNHRHRQPSFAFGARVRKRTASRFHAFGSFAILLKQTMSLCAFPQNSFQQASRRFAVAFEIAGHCHRRLDVACSLQVQMDIGRSLNISAAAQYGQIINYFSSLQME